MEGSVFFKGSNGYNQTICLLISSSFFPLTKIAINMIPINVPIPIPNKKINIVTPFFSCILMLSQRTVTFYTLF